MAPQPRWLRIPDLPVLYRDEAVLVVHKPARVSALPADISTRVRAQLQGPRTAARPPYLSVMPQLDLDTSGVLVCSSMRAANGRLAQQLERGAGCVTYLAVVVGWSGPRERLLEDRVLKRGGSVERLGSGDRRGRPAVTEARVIERCGDRCLLSLRIAEGRLSQLRAQLAGAGCPIVGDGEHGGAPAHRLMLHAHQMDLDHPLSGQPLRVEAPLPWAMQSFLSRGNCTPSGQGELATALRSAAERRWALLGDASTTAFRWVNGEGDGLPGLLVDVYGDHAVVQLLDGEMSMEREEVLSAVHQQGPLGVYLKLRPRQANELAGTRREDIAPKEPVRGVPARTEITVTEHGIPFHARLGDGLSTGIFLDQRENRRTVRGMAPGRSVLNLFSYTCAFTVAAVFGGARRTVSVDASSVALAQGRRNVERAASESENAFIKGDVFEVLADLSKKRERFDLVLVDPPTYSSTKASRWSSGRDWPALAHAVLSVAEEGGTILFCSNDQRMGLHRFRRYLEDGVRRAGACVSETRAALPPEDFPPPCGADPHLKSVWMRLAEPGEPPRSSGEPRRRRRRR